MKANKRHIFLPDIHSKTNNQALLLESQGVDITEAFLGDNPPRLDDPTDDRKEQLQQLADNMLKMSGREASTKVDDK